MTDTAVKHRIGGSMIDRQLHADLVDFYIADDAGAFNFQCIIVARNLFKIPQRAQTASRSNFLMQPSLITL